MFGRFSVVRCFQSGAITIRFLLIPTTAGVRFLLAKTATKDRHKARRRASFTGRDRRDRSARRQHFQPGQRLAFSGVWGGVRALLAATLARHASHILMVLPQAADADIVAEDAIAYGIDDAIPLPLSAAEGSGASIRDADYADRLQVLQQLIHRDNTSPKPLVVTAYVGGAMQLVPTPTRWKLPRAP